MDQRSWSKEPASRWLSAEGMCLRGARKRYVSPIATSRRLSTTSLKTARARSLETWKLMYPGVGLKERLLHACED